MCAHLWNWLVPKMAKVIENTVAARKNQAAACAGKSAAPTVGAMEMKQLLPLVSTKSWRVNSFWPAGWAGEGRDGRPPAVGPFGGAPEWGHPSPHPRPGAADDDPHDDAHADRRAAE